MTAKTYPSAEEVATPQLFQKQRHHARSHQQQSGDERKVGLLAPGWRVVQVLCRVVELEPLPTARGHQRDEFLFVHRPREVHDGVCICKG